MDAAKSEFEEFIDWLMSNLSIPGNPSRSSIRDCFERGLKKFIDSCKSNPSLRSDILLLCIRNRLESLIAELSSSAYEDGTISWSDEVMVDTEEVKVDSAMKAVLQGQPNEALESLSEAIVQYPKSALLYASRARVYIMMKEPNAAIRDADAALMINPSSTKGYESRGIARAMLGQWEEAAKDLELASELDYDEESNTVLKKVELNAHRLKEHCRKHERLHNEGEEREIEHRRKRRRVEAQAAYEKAKKQVQSSSSGKHGSMPGGFPDGMCGGFPGGMPGGFLGGMPSGMPDYSKIFNDPAMMAAYGDPEVRAALQDVIKNSANPKAARVIAKMMSKFAGPG